MKKKIAVLLANGFEEGEGLLTVDVLLRAGFDCRMVGVEGQEVTGSHGIRVIADELLSEVRPEDYDMVVLPGGLPGANTLRDTEEVVSWVKLFAGAEGKYVAAICAAPQVLAKAGVVSGKKVTSYPGGEPEAALKAAGGRYEDDNTRLEECVAVDGNIITSRGPATTLPFAYKLVELLGGDADALREGMQYNALKMSLCCED